jgi:hypothetical protein
MSPVRTVFWAIVLALGGVVYAGFRSWPRLSRGKRIASVLLVAPHFLLAACIVFAMLYSRAPMGSPRSNTVFFAEVLMVFILPVPALVGTVVALSLFFSARKT